MNKWNKIMIQSVCVGLIVLVFFVGVIVGLNQKAPEYYSEIHYRMADVYDNIETGVTVYLSKGNFYADGTYLVKVVRHRNDSPGANVVGYGQSPIGRGK